MGVMLVVTYETEIKEKLKELHYTHRQVAIDMECTEATVQRKLNGIRKFTKAEKMLIEHLIAEKEKEIKKNNL